MRKQELEEVLAQRMNLKAPQFKLAKFGNKFGGHVVSDTFKGKTDFQRQAMIFGALEAEYGKGAAKQIGMILAYTADEWGIDLEGFHGTDRRKARAG